MNMVGKKYHRLFIVRFTGMVNNQSIFLCKCDCGIEKEIIGSCIKRGLIKSCGCIRKETTKRLHTKHGESKTKFYKVWSHMIQICTMPTIKEYPRYGGRGIFVCKEWLESYLAFKKDVYDGYSEGLELDRKDNNDGYYKENVRWVTHKQNNNNKRSNSYLEINGVIKTAMEWSEIYGLNSRCISNRIKSGYRGIEALYGVQYLKRNSKIINKAD